MRREESSLSLSRADGQPTLATTSYLPVARVLLGPSDSATCRFLVSLRSVKATSSQRDCRRGALLIRLRRRYNACPGATRSHRFTSRLAGLGLSE